MESRNISERIKTLRGLFSLDDFMCACLELLLLNELEGQFLEEGQEAGPPFPGISFSELCRIKEDVREETDWNRLMLFADEIWIDGRSFLRLKEEVFYYLTEGVWIAKETEACALRLPEDAEEPEQKLYLRMLTLLDKRREHAAEGTLLLHLAGEEGSGRRENICLFAKKQKTGVRLLEADKIKRETDSVRKRIYGLLLLECRLGGKIPGIFFEADTKKDEAVLLVRESCGIWKGEAPLVLAVTGRDIGFSGLSGEGLDYAFFPVGEEDSFHTKNTVETLRGRLRDPG